MLTIDESLALAQNCDIQLQNIKFNKAALELSGIGRLKRNDFGEITLIAKTNGRDEIAKEFIHNGGHTDLSQQGKLANSSQLWTITGKTPDGWNLCFNLFDYGQLYEWRSDQPEINWCFPLSTITMCREPEILHTAGYLKAIFSHHGELDKLFWQNLRRVDTDIGKFVITIKQDNLLVVEAYELIEALNIEKLVIALGFTLSFAHGHRVLPVFYDAGINKVEQRRWSGRATPNKNSLVSPFYQHMREPLWNQREPFLTKSVPFFMSDKGQTVGTYLNLCWDTLDNTISIQAVVIGLVVEGLIRTLRKTINIKQYDAEINKLNMLLNASENQFSKDFRQRVIGFLDSSLPHERPKDIMIDWIKRGILGIEDKDFAAWSDLRNPTSHASLVNTFDKNKLQKHIDARHLCINLINKLTLQAMEFVGDFIDYSKPGWPPIVFPRADPDKLRPST